MNKLAYDNLTLLDEVYSDSLHLISDHNILSLIEKDNFLELIERNQRSSVRRHKPISVINFIDLTSC